NRLLKSDDVDWVNISKDRLLGEFHKPQTIRNERIGKFSVRLPEGTTANWQFTQWLLINASDAGVGVDTNNSSKLISFINPLIPWVFIFFFVWFFIVRQIR